MTETHDDVSRPYVCTFCDKGRDRVALMVEGRGGVCICDECIVLCHDLLMEQGVIHTPKAGAEVKGPPFHMA